MKPWSRRAKWSGIGGFAVAVLIGLDQFGNALLGGDPDMTISTRCGLVLAHPEQASWYDTAFCKPVCWGLDLIDENHCPDARE